MTRRALLLDLAARCEAASTTDADIDHEIGKVMHGLGWHAADCIVRFTRSLDAAISLVPEGWAIAEMKDAIRHEDGAYCQIRLWCPPNPYLGYLYRSNGATPPLALTAAALRALAAQIGEGEA